MSKTKFNSYLIKAILHVLKQFSDKKIGILHKNLSTRDYVVFYPVLVYKCRLSAHIRLEFIE